MSNYKNLIDALKKEGALGGAAAALPTKAAIKKAESVPVEVQEPSLEELLELSAAPITPVQDLLAAKLAELQESEIELTEDDYISEVEPSKKTASSDSVLDMLNQMFIELDKLRLEVQGLRLDLKTAGVKPNLASKPQGTVTPAGVAGTLG